MKEFDEEERELIHRRRVLQGRIDLIGAQFVQRSAVALSPEKMGGEGNRFERAEGEC